MWDEAPGNLAFDWGVGDIAAVERALAAARHRVTLDIVNNRVVVNSMEPRGAIGDYDPGEDAYTLWSSTQGSHFLRSLLAESIFKIPENRIRVVTHDVGGGFGMKFFLYPEQILVLWAAKKLGRPVKWTVRALGRVHDRHAGPRQRDPARTGARRRAALSRAVR